ncbi:MAG TPA: pyridoxal-phosphate dependent enzyme [Candidatus Thermoplasmatota archaeon]
MRHRALPAEAPGRREIAAAERTLRRYASVTPLIPSAMGKGNGFLKLETLSPTGSFKWRGVLYRMLRLSRARLNGGVVTASTGNHGFAVGWAAANLGAPATVVVPHGTPTFKQDRIKTTGAQVIVSGTTWNDSLLVARDIAQRDGSTPIEDGADPILMAGTATLGWEILKQLPNMGAVVAPVGGGNLIAALACALEADGSGAKLIGVQSSAARGAYDSWKKGRILARPVKTIAGGIATAGPVPFSFEIMRRRVDAMHLVSDRQMLRAVGRLATMDGIVAEPSGAAPVAALPGLRLARNASVALVVTGRSIEGSTLTRAIRDVEA